MQIIRIGSMRTQREEAKRAQLPFSALEFCTSEREQNVLLTLLCLELPVPKGTVAIAEVGWEWTLRDCTFGSEIEFFVRQNGICLLWLVPLWPPGEFDPHCIATFTWKELLLAASSCEGLLAFLQRQIEGQTGKTFADTTRELKALDRARERHQVVNGALRVLSEDLPRSWVLGRT